MRSAVALLMAGVLLVAGAPGAVAGFHSDVPLRFARPATLTAAKGLTPGTSCGIVPGQAIAQAAASNKRPRKSRAACVLRSSSVIEVPALVTTVVIRTWGRIGERGDCSILDPLPAFSGTFRAVVSHEVALRGSSGDRRLLTSGSSSTGCLVPGYPDNYINAIVDTPWHTPVCTVVSVTPGTTYRAELTVRAQASGVATKNVAWAVGRAEVTHIAMSYEFAAGC